MKNYLVLSGVGGGEIQDILKNARRSLDNARYYLPEKPGDRVPSIGPAEYHSILRSLDDVASALQSLVNVLGDPDD